MAGDGRESGDLFCGEPGRLQFMESQSQTQLSTQRKKALEVEEKNEWISEDIGQEN